MIEQEMKESLKLYSVKSKELELSKELLDEKRKQFDIQNNDLISEITNLDSQVNGIKDIVKEQAETQYKETGEKKLMGGIGIRILTKLDYASQEAIGWAKTNMPIAVLEVLDRKQFETFAKNNDIAFVTKEESVCVTFPKELNINELE